MPAGKSRDFPMPGTHIKCRSCPIGLLCLSGRRSFGRRGWCQRCKGVYYQDLDMTVQCVVFRSKRARYREKYDSCRACGYAPWGVKPHGRLVSGITHQDARNWREGKVYASGQIAGS